jgi:hypothetical protein
MTGTGDDLRRIRDTEVFDRLRRIESDVAAIKAMLEERCFARQKILDDHDMRLRHLEEADHKRKGGIAVLGIMLTLAASAGAVATKMLWG